MSGRIDRIRCDLNMAQHHGLVRDRYCYAPGDGGRRWVVSIRTADMGLINRTLTTRETESLAYRLAAGEALTYDQVERAR